MRRLALLALVLVLVACGGDEDSSLPTTTISGADPTTAAPEPGTTSDPDESGPDVLLETAGGEEVVVRVEIADTDEERQVGLMNRESLPEDAGMIFLFDDDVSGGFWMKNTLIPLSIAFVDADGTILSILDMEPCEADPCEIYDPGVSYRSALEVNQGAFAEWGVAEGDRLTLRQ
ncbi:MAG TPA: DUF192 domain-containing protein [Gaiellaceae bacterium]|nr:DUF192 domain-containing protein [Gaiellaceae bacterium]